MQARAAIQQQLRGQLGIDCDLLSGEALTSFFESQPPSFCLTSAHNQLEQLLDHILRADFRAVGKACLPLDLKDWANQQLRGRYILQLDEVINLCAPAKERFSGGAGERCLKVHLTDGHQQVVGLELRPVPDLTLQAPAGLKVAISDVTVRKGVLLLQPENVLVLGGQVEHLEAARQKAVGCWIAKTSGHRGSPLRPARVPDLLAEAAAAAWAGDINQASTLATPAAPPQSPARAAQTTPSGPVSAVNAIAASRQRAAAVAQEDIAQAIPSAVPTDLRQTPPAVQPHGRPVAPQPAAFQWAGAMDRAGVHSSGPVGTPAAAVTLASQEPAQGLAEGVQPPGDLVWHEDGDQQMHTASPIVISDSDAEDDGADQLSTPATLRRRRRKHRVLLNNSSSKAPRHGCAHGGSASSSGHAGHEMSMHSQQAGQPDLPAAADGGPSCDLKPDEEERQPNLPSQGDADMADGPPVLRLSEFVTNIETTEPSGFPFHARLLAKVVPMNSKLNYKDGIYSAEVHIEDASTSCTGLLSHDFLEGWIGLPPTELTAALKDPETKQRVQSNLATMKAFLNNFAGVLDVVAPTAGGLPVVASLYNDENLARDVFQDLATYQER